MKVLQFLLTCTYSAAFHIVSIYNQLYVEGALDGSQCRMLGRITLEDQLNHNNIDLRVAKELNGRPSWDGSNIKKE